MPFDFDIPTNRRDTFSMKWNVPEYELPMWVADMDFNTAPPVVAALQKRLEQGIFGYTDIPPEYAKAVAGWWGTRHGVQFAPEAILFATGVVPAISSIIRKLTTPAENVLIQPPVYNIFYNSILNNGRQVLESPLLYSNGSYTIDFADLEQKLANPQTTLMLLCNPHNPIGKVWSPETLQRIGTLCAKHHVVVVSDEIHCDLTHPSVQYTPFASLPNEGSQNSITCIAPTKAFNLAGLQTASVVVPNPVLRHKVNRGLNTDEVAEPNAFAMQATIAAFTQGAQWVDELRAYIAANKEYAASFIAENLPQIQAVSSTATYLLWLDCSAITADASALCDFLRKETGLYLAAGATYGATGKTFLRMNLGTQKARVQDGLQRLQQGVGCYLNKAYP